MTFGFGAVGRAGNASAPEAVGRLELAGVVEADRLGVLVNEGRAEEGVGAAAAQGVADGAWERREDDPEAERGGKAFVDVADDGKAPLLPTADRDDWAVDDFKRNTREPPVLTVLADMPGRRPPGPGRAG